MLTMRWLCSSARLFRAQVQSVSTIYGVLTSPLSCHCSCTQSSSLVWTDQVLCAGTYRRLKGTRAILLIHRKESCSI